MSTKLALGLGLPAALLAAVIGAGIVIVDLKHGGPDGRHVFFPVPLILVRAAAAMVPADQGRIECSELARHREMALRLVHELRGAPDAELVRVTEPDGTVLIRKAGGLFEVKAEQRTKQVRVRVPAAAIEELLASCDGKAFNPGFPI